MDAEWLAFRQGYYHLLGGLFGHEPSTVLLATLRNGLPARAEAAKALHPMLGQGWVSIAAWLDGGALDALTEPAQDEFSRLFVGPFDTELYPYESYYLTGKTFDRPLAAVREFLKRAGIEKDPAYAEPEDAIAFELEVMRRLAARHAQATDPDAAARSERLQAEFLTRHLLVWGPAFADDLVHAQGAVLYRGIGLVLAGFLDLERDVVAAWGSEPPLLLEEARAAYRGASPWQGPLFDAETDAAAGGDEATGKEDSA